MAAADLDTVSAIDDGVLGMELAVGLLEGLGDALYAFNDVHRLKQEGIDLGGVSHQADDGLVLALTIVSLKALLFDPAE